MSAMPIGIINFADPLKCNGIKSIYVINNTVAIIIDSIARDLTFIYPELSLEIIVINKNASIDNSNDCHGDRLNVLQIHHALNRKILQPTNVLF